MIPDVNVLVAAFRADHPLHATARQWLDRALQAPRTSRVMRSTIHLLPVVVASFLRLTTHPLVFKQPDTLEDATAFVDALLALPEVSYLTAGAPWAQFRQLCLENQLGAPLVTNALIAAGVLQQQDVLVTFDQDFCRLLPPNNLQLLVHS